MIVWTEDFPRMARPLGFLRLLLARHRFFDRVGFGRKPGGKIGFKKIQGYQSRMRKWRNRLEGRRCFILGNGPSLNKMDLSPLRKEITIGTNGIYKRFPEWGFHTNYLMFEDIQQTELRGKDIPHIKGPTILASIYNAYAFKAPRKSTVFMNVRLADWYYSHKMAPMFSTDFSEIVYLGATVTYLAIQLAYHLGCDPVYLIGVDHNYGELAKIFPPGKIRITEENIHLVKGLHFDQEYFKVGDRIGVPFMDYQEKSYRRAREVFTQSGRRIYNAGIDSKLDCFERASYDELFEKKAK